MNKPHPALELVVPSPVRRLALDGQGELWVKDDSAISPIYGGNKARKLAWLLPRALEVGARRLVTIGVAGSHHVLATARFGAAVGLPVTAILLPRPASDAAHHTLGATLRAEPELLPCGGLSDALATLRRLGRRGDYFIPPGGSSPLGARGYCAAVAELAGQVEAGLLPEPDLIVVAVGTGGTGAGLLAGLRRSRLASELVGVGVVPLPGLASLVRLLAWRVPHDVGAAGSPHPAAFHLDRRWLGRGYGWETAEGAAAAREAESVGLTLEPTYTAKAFAAALDHHRAPKNRERLTISANSPNRPVVLFWNTYCAGAFSSEELSPTKLPSGLARLLYRR